MIPVSHRDTAAIRIRVGSQHQICACTLTVLESQFHCFSDLGIWIRAGREIAVRIALLLDHSDIGETTLFKHSRYRFQSGSIKWRVYDGK